MVEYNQFGFRVFGPEWRAKLSRAKLGNQNGVKPYPAFIHRDTGEVIPAGVNLTAMCRERGIGRSGLWQVKSGRISHYKGWVLADLVPGT